MYTSLSEIIVICYSVGQRQPNKTVDWWSSLNQLHPNVKLGGSYMPTDCQPRQKLAIIIPYKGRPEQLKVLLNNLHPFLQRQDAHYQIFVTEPVSEQVSEHIYGIQA